ncbi:MAG: aminotransferase class I/II-fold pyridoxal phosphate-dependent enzyme [Syntrophotaleaceae bacterium]
MPTPIQQLSPLRNTTHAEDPAALTAEQLRHFGIDPESDYGRALADLTLRLYQAQGAVHELWRLTSETLGGLEREDRIAWFNAKRFASFQLAKILDALQNPLRRTYRSISVRPHGFAGRGAYPLFDNVAAIFSANPVITRTATYLFACTEWVEDAFHGREPLLDIYSRLFNPTSISLAHHMVDLEAGPLAGEYLAWNFNSGMAAIDSVLAHVTGARDIIVASRNVYGGTYQLLHDWYAKKGNLDIALEWFDGFDGPAFEKAFQQTREKYAGRLEEGRRIYVYLESPCNPHGTILDVPEISRIAHRHGSLVICDTTVGTPVLFPVLQRRDLQERPDFVIHSYTKDLSGSGTTIAGVVIGRNERMFLPKGESAVIDGPDGRPQTIPWEETLFWNVYYVKGAFLDADKAFEVLNGLRTLEGRILQKGINTLVLTRILDRHPDINVHSPALEDHPNGPLREKLMFLGLPAPLFSIDFEGKKGRPPVPRDAFKRFFDSLEPAVGLQVSLGQTNTMALCPALTSHSELSPQALKEAGIALTTTRISVGLEDPRALIAHMLRAAQLAIEPSCPGFCAGFPEADEIDRLYRTAYLAYHRRFIEAQPDFTILAS